MSDEDRLQEEMEVLFGKEAVRLAVAQEFLARRFALKNPIELRKALNAFQLTKDIEEQKAFADDMDKDLKRAFICALLCDTATKALQEIAVDAIDDRRAGRAVLPDRLQAREPSGKKSLLEQAKRLKRRR